MFLNNQPYFATLPRPRKYVCAPTEEAGDGAWGPGRHPTPTSRLPSEASWILDSRI